MVGRGVLIFTKPAGLAVVLSSLFFYAHRGAIKKIYTEREWKSWAVELVLNAKWAVWEAEQVALRPDFILSHDEKKKNFWRRNSQINKLTSLMHVYPVLFTYLSTYWLVYTEYIQMGKLFWKSCTTTTKQVAFVYIFTYCEDIDPVFFKVLRCIGTIFYLFIFVKTIRRALRI